MAATPALTERDHYYVGQDIRLDPRFTGPSGPVVAGGVRVVVTAPDGQPRPPIIAWATDAEGQYAYLTLDAPGAWRLVLSSDTPYRAVERRVVQAVAA